MLPTNFKAHPVISPAYHKQQVEASQPCDKHCVVQEVLTNRPKAHTVQSAAFPSISKFLFQWLVIAAISLLPGEFVFIRDPP